MPKAALKPCSHPGCTELVQSGSLCAAHRRQREQERGSAGARGYDYEWRKIRDAFLLNPPVCCDPYGRHRGRGIRAVHVDHKVPLSQGGTNAESNLQGLCTSCHSFKTATSDGGFGNRIHSPRGNVNG